MHIFYTVFGVFLVSLTVNFFITARKEEYEQMDSKEGLKKFFKDYLVNVIAFCFSTAVATMGLVGLVLIGKGLIFLLT